MPIKKTLTLRMLLVLMVIITFITLCSIFIFQFRQYKDVENRLNNTYSNNSKLSPSLYQLFSTFSEVDNLFRLYAISFDDKNFIAYKNKLDTLSAIIQSVDTITHSPQNNSSNITLINESLSLQYIAMKKQIDDLIIFADKNIATPATNNRNNLKKSNLNADSVINRILNDTLTRVSTKADTIIKKKEGLFNRIFNAKNDTVLNTNNTAMLNVNQIDIIQKNIENLIQTNESIYLNNYNQLRKVYLLSKEQERKLITSNYNLISQLKTTIETVREIEFQKLRSAEEEDYNLYKLNTDKFRLYAIIALCVILLMLLFIIYYQYVVSKYEKKLIKEKDYASLLAEEKTNLLANISHEIRTPLNSLKGVVHLLTNKNTEELDDSILSNINYDISVINNTVNDILNLSKIESNSTDVGLDDVFISKIINDTAGMHKFQAKQKGLKFINENNLNDILQIKSNEFRLRQIISNLINNAIKYTKEGNIKVVSNQFNDKITIEVIDTGVGIAESKLDQIFRKYYTVDGEKTKVGFGLGLHISQLLAKQIGGKLSVKSQLNLGSTFTLQIPNTKSAGIKNETFKVTQELPKDLSIVIIDDNKINLLIAKQHFNTYSDIHYFEDGRLALDYIEKNHPKIVITDIIMPKISGWEILEAVKSNKKLSHTKIIANTAEYSMAENNNSKLKFDAVLEKGYDVQKIAEVYFK